MLKWEDRPFEVAYSLNPAFLSVLLYQAIHGFQTEKKDENGMPYALIFLVIPLVFYTVVRESLPTKKNYFLHDWVKDNPEVATRLHSIVSQLVPYTKESIIFAMQNKMILINSKGQFINERHKQKIELLEWDKESRTYNMKEKAEFLGKWFAQSGSVEIIYRTLGITL